MQLISPEIVTTASGLSIGASGFALFVGLLLWSCGWRWHKFWVVFGITTAAGMIGLSAGQAVGSQVLVLGVLLAFAGGVMALEVAKLLAFAGGGLAAWLCVQTVVPQAHEMWAVFLAGGLMGVLLYRLWTILLTSLLGVLVAGHATCVMAAEGQMITAKWLIENAAALNGAVLVLTVLGVVVQTIVSREAIAEVEEAEMAEPKTESKNADVKKSWWKLAA